MDKLEEMLAGSSVNPIIEIPKVSEKKTNTLLRKDERSVSRPDPKNQKPKGTTLNAVKSSKSGSDKAPKRKEPEKSTPEVVLKKVREELVDIDVEGSDGCGREAKLHKVSDKKQKDKEKTVDDVTEADFDAVARVAKLWAEAIKKMKAAVSENTPDRLQGMYLETQAYNCVVEAKLARTRQELKAVRGYWYAELLKENRLLREEFEKNNDLKKKLAEVKTKAVGNKKKADDLANVAKDLELAREDLERVRKEAEDAEVKAATRIAELERKCQQLKNDGAEMTVAGYTRCLTQALVLEPNLQTRYMQLLHRVEDDKILSKDKVIFPRPEPEAEKVANAGDQNEAESPGVGGDGGDVQTPADADHGGEMSPGKDDVEMGEN